MKDGYCSHCEGTLKVEDVAVSFGAAPLCSPCLDQAAAHERDVNGLKERIAALEQALLEAEIEATAKSQADAGRIAALEDELTEARAARWPGPRSRPSSLA